MTEIPKYADDIIKSLYENGFEAYLVGGCVRDMLMGKNPSDYDIATNAKPEEIKRIFRKTIDTGIRHGTVTVLAPGGSVEVTTYRAESEYEKSRRPKTVLFISDLETDLSRRDFTINALAWNRYNGLLDYFGGRKDIEKKIIKAVGDPDLRFYEDALRMLRAVRFSAVLGFSLDQSVRIAIKKNAKSMENISGERIKAELDKILLSDRPEALFTLYETGLLEVIMPELARCFETGQNTKYHLHDVGRHTLGAVACAPKDPVLRWAMLLHDIGKPAVKTTDIYGVDHFPSHAEEGGAIARAIMNRLKCGNAFTHQVSTLVAEHDTDILPDKREIKRLLNRIGKDLFLQLLIVKKCDLAAKNPKTCAPEIKERSIIQKMTDEIVENREPFSLKDLEADGADLLKLGFRGKEIGQGLAFLLEHVLLCPEDNQKDVLIRLIEDKKPITKGN